MNPVEIGPPRWVWRILTIGVAAVIVLVGAGVVVVTLDVRDRFDAQREVLAALQDASAREDCRSAIVAAYGEIRDRRDNAGWAAVFASSERGLSPEHQAQYDLLRLQLSLAIAEASAQPPLSDAVRDGITLGGVRYNACPAVK